MLVSQGITDTVGSIEYPRHHEYSRVQTPQVPASTSHKMSTPDALCIPNAMSIPVHRDGSLKRHPCLTETNGLGSFSAPILCMPGHNTLGHNIHRTQHTKPQYTQATTLDHYMYRPQHTRPQHTRLQHTRPLHTQAITCQATTCTGHN